MAHKPRGETLLSVEADASASDLLSWLTAMSAVLAAELRQDDTLLVLSSANPRDVENLFAIVHTGPVVAATESRDRESRKILSESTSTGRAEAVVALQDGREAVKAVIRGGSVCLPDHPLNMPSVTELVQREVQLFGVRNVVQIVQSISRETLEDRLTPVLVTLNRKSTNA